ncbi:putative DNA replication protein [Peptoclostridium acidaminophilum DSM 3953]|uniref:Putative DNA replication protein n=1 Tax=Peptoclostridium acidaminophilum DSM 3953 TaxID=1286171 RepID=W8U9D2_PEPAC|nr:ATP-binding protein [Peptoclostridium acidaminophilum]AHM57476.1 putative DNA replication protein [Peptoclostridium acidaminophilum DSM 3953]
MREETLRKILLKYEKKRDLAAINLELRKKKLYSVFPRLEEIEGEIFRLGLKMGKLALDSPDNLESIVESCKQSLEALKREKESIMKASGFPTDYLSMQYECPLCKDRGFLSSGEKCRCLKQELIDEAYKMSNLKQVLSKENLSTFNLDIFSDDKSSASVLSPKENMATILAICDDFIRNFPKNNGENLLFYGTTGSGKTFMCNCIAKELLDRGNFVIYQTAFSLFAIIEGYRFQKKNSAIDKESYESLFECDLLIIDDLGIEIQNSFTNSELFHIINTRLINEKKTVISTNFNLSELSQRYTDRIFSRISSSFRPLKFFGNDLRWEKGNK